MTRLEALRDDLGGIIADGMSPDHVAHARQVARVGIVLEGAFRDVSIQPVVVGGSALEVHAPGAYVSGDIDVVVDGARGVRTDPQVLGVLRGLDLRRRGMNWVRDELVLHLVGRQMSDPALEARLDGLSFQVAAPEVVLADRTIGFKWWRETSYGQQAIDLLALLDEGDYDRGWLEGRLGDEDALDALEALERLVRGSSEITETTLAEIQGDLRSPETGDRPPRRARSGRAGASRQRTVDLGDVWPDRVRRLRALRGRVDIAGMTRPPRDPVERELLAERDQLGPFTESEGSTRDDRPSGPTNG